jgi:hypothetical protein
MATRKGARTKEERLAEYRKRTGTESANNRTTVEDDVFDDSVQDDDNQAPYSTQQSSYEQTTTQNPIFAAPLKERSYASGQDIEVEGEMPDEIAAPTQRRQKVVFGDTSSTGAPSFQDDNVFSTERNDDGSGEETPLSDKEKDVMSGNIADTMVDGLKTVYGFVGAAVKKDENSLMFKAAQGKFDMRILEMQINMGGEFVSVKDFLCNYNSTVDELMQLAPDTEAELRECLRRIAKKRDMGMSDESRILMIMATEVATKGFAMYNLSRSMNLILKNQAEELTRRSQPTKSPVVDATDSGKSARGGKAKINIEDISEVGER